MPEPTNLPFDELATAMEEVFNKGATVLTKWTCGGCGQRAIANEPNELHTSYRHEDCGYVTDLTKTGGGFTAVFAVERREA